MNKSLPKDLHKLAYQFRLELLELIHVSSGGHIGGALSAMDLLVTIYYSKLFNLPQSTDFLYDKFILSNAHICPALYVLLANFGAFDKKHLATYGRLGSMLQGHSSLETPGILYAGGLLGQGLSFAAGLALGDPTHTTICLTSDGEHQEGQVWEAAAFAAKYQLKNLINLVDINQYQIDGSTDQIMPLGSLAQKYLDFGWQVQEIDGHNYQQIYSALNSAKNSTRPNCILAYTQLGKGISFMESNFLYHDVKKLEPDLYLQAKRELKLQIL